jgi:hypothetical protein
MQRRMEQLESLDACPPPPPPSSDDDGPDPLNRYGAVRDDTEPLYSHLCAQLEASDAEKCVRAVAGYFAQGLDKNGYLDEDCADVSARLGLPLSKIEAGLALLQSLDPAGVGARSLRECLLLQPAPRGGITARWPLRSCRTIWEDVGRPIIRASHAHRMSPSPKFMRRATRSARLTRGRQPVRKRRARGLHTARSARNKKRKPALRSR